MAGALVWLKRPLWGGTLGRHPGQMLKPLLQLGEWAPHAMFYNILSTAKCLLTKETTEVVTDDHK